MKNTGTHTSPFLFDPYTGIVFMGLNFIMKKEHRKHGD